MFYTNFFAHYCCILVVVRFYWRTLIISYYGTTRIICFMNVIEQPLGYRNKLHSQLTVLPLINKKSLWIFPLKHNFYTVSSEQALEWVQDLSHVMSIICINVLHTMFSSDHKLTTLSPMSELITYSSARLARVILTL